jgi:hypothetical protein
MGKRPGALFSSVVEVFKFVREVDWPSSRKGLSHIWLKVKDQSKIFFGTSLSSRNIQEAMV